MPSETGTGIDNDFVFLSVFDDFDIIVRTAVVVFEIDVGDFAADTRPSRFFGLGAADDFVLFAVLVCGVSVVVIAVSVVVGECGGGNAQQCGCGGGQEKVFDVHICPCKSGVEKWGY